MFGNRTNKLGFSFLFSGKDSWASLKNILEEYREPLVLFYREDQSVQQVANQLGLTQDAVKQRLVRGRAMLKSEVEQFVEDLLGSTKPSAYLDADSFFTFHTFEISAYVTPGLVARVRVIPKPNG